MKKLLFILSIVLIGCKTYNEEEINQFDKQIKNYIKKNHLKLEKSESGLYYHTDFKGEGEEIQYNDKVSFRYEGKLLNGKIFDKQSKKPISFHIKELIAGWKEGLVGATIGSKLTLIVPPHLGYGDHDLDDIPPHSILVFKMEIVGKE